MLHSRDRLVSVRPINVFAGHQRTPDLHVVDDVMKRLAQSAMSDVVFSVEHFVREFGADCQQLTRRPCIVSQKTIKQGHAIH